MRRVALAAVALAVLAACGGAAEPPPPPTPEPTPTLREIQDQREDAACGIVGRYLAGEFRLRGDPECTAFDHATDRVLVTFTFGTIATIGRSGYTCTARVDFYETRLVLVPERDWHCSPMLPR